MKSKSTRKTNVVAAKPTKSKTALNLRDLPPRKNPVGGAMRKNEESDK
jgi:hypothetical protein